MELGQHPAPLGTSRHLYRSSVAAYQCGRPCAVSSPPQRRGNPVKEGKKEDSQHDQASNCVPCQKACQIGGKFIHRGDDRP